MHRLYITFCFCLFTFYLSAQESYPFFNNMKGERKIIADTVITRVAPSTGAALDDTLYFGNTVEILMAVPYTEVRNNMVSPWLKVVYQKGKFKKVGFVSAIDVALNNKLVYKNYEFVWGVIANNKKDIFINNELVNKNNYQCKLVAMQNGKRVAVSEFGIDGSFIIDSVYAELFSSIKLKNTLCFIKIFTTNRINNLSNELVNNIIFCKEKKLILLPVTLINNNCSEGEKSLITMYFKNKSEFVVQFFYKNFFPHMFNDFYSWNNCSYELMK